ncbi:MAG: CRISPR-associated endonuclease Cas3'' [Paenibacillaceae bacterium]
MILAHSSTNGNPPQPYRSHVNGVVVSAQNNLNNLIRFIQSENHVAYHDTLANAAVFHDLGKLDEENQNVLKDEANHSRLPIEHRDAGVKYLLEQMNNRNAAILVYSHHRPGLPNLIEERCKAFPFRFAQVKSRTDSNLDDYIRTHSEEVGIISTLSTTTNTKLSSTDYRMLLSCLIDADYSDTSGIKLEISQTRWEERIRKLDRYVENLQKQSRDSSERETPMNILRQEMFSHCKATKCATNIVYCDSPVGTGKTTAVMAHLLQVAKERNLRHIIVVMPYTNIISQAVEIFREALVLDGEDPCNIVAEHHHQADYDSKNLRHLASTWTAPITITTAVQFFESLASNIPSKLRKLHQLPGSAVFIDESHAALPIRLMLPAWSWIKELSEKFSCYICLCSGTTMKFWETSSFKKEHAVSVEPLLSESMASKLYRFEGARVCVDALSLKPSHFTDSKNLASYIIANKGPRLVVMNTVQSAAALAKQMQRMGCDVLHLSTALTPEDREYVLREVRTRLKVDSTSDHYNNWTLVATSCVECGLNLSFRNGFCELRSLQSYLQLSGRINRNGEYDDASLVCFTVYDPLFNKNPLFDKSISVFKKLIDQGSLLSMQITEAVTLSFDMECKEAGGLPDLICRKDKSCAFVDVAQSFRVIDEDTVTVIAKRSLISRMERGESITPTELMRGSINIRRATVSKLQLQPISGFSDVLQLTESQYDSFLGYAKGLID